MREPIRSLLEAVRRATLEDAGADADITGNNLRLHEGLANQQKEKS
jgi:hypothetical protein